MRPKAKSSVFLREAALIIAGIASVHLGLGAAGAAYLAGIDDPYPSIEAYPAEIPSILSLPLAIAFAFSLVVCAIVWVLGLTGHPKPWRAPCKTAILALLPTLCWATANTIDKVGTGGNVGLVVQPPAWVSWEIFDFLESPFQLFLILSYATYCCTKQWVSESENAAIIQPNLLRKPQS
jgi:hypothetical protein